MATTEELYDNLPDAFKQVFETKDNRKAKMKEEGKTPFDVIKEMLEKIKSINKQS